MYNDHFRLALEELDIALIRKLWAHVMPHLPQPQTNEEALTCAHIARTASQSLDFKYKAYSHSWLRERGLPSQLPDSLRPRAERLYPTTIPAVGIAVRYRAPTSLLIRGAMEEAVLDAGVKDASLTKRAILSARTRMRKYLGLD